MKSYYVSLVEKKITFCNDYRFDHIRNNEQKPANQVKRPRRFGERRRTHCDYYNRRNYERYQSEFRILRTVPELENYRNNNNINNNYILSRRFLAEKNIMNYNIVFGTRILSDKRNLIVTSRKQCPVAKNVHCRKISTNIHSYTM